jgi:hypothetical protein
MTTTRTQRPLYRELASLLQAIENCRKSSNLEWHGRHQDRLAKLVSNGMPSGGGIDNGTKLDIDACRPGKLVFTFGYHHMNESGMYDGWTEHVLTVTPSFDGIDLRISGRDRNQIKEYLYETYHYALTQAVEIE